MAQTRTPTEQPTAARRAILAPSQLTEWIPRACAEVAGYLYRHDIMPSGFPYARWHRLRHDLIGVEAGFPVATPIPGGGQVEPSTLPAGPVLVASYTGPEERLGLAYQEIDDWLQSAQTERNGDGWEIYHDLPAFAHDHRHLEVIQPIVVSLTTV